MEKLYLKDIFLRPLSGEWGKEVKNDEKGHPVIRTTNFTNIGEINYDNLAYRNIDVLKKKNKLLKNGDIIIEKSGGTPKTPVGRVVYFDNDDPNYFTNNFTAILRTKDGFDSKYLFYMMYYFHKIGVVLKYQNKTTGIINLKLTDYLKNTIIKIPQIDIQNSTVDKLDKLKNLIQTRQEQIQALDNLVESVFDDLLNKNDVKFTALDDLITKKPDRLSNKNTEPISYFDISSIDNISHKIIEEKNILNSEDRPSRAKQLIMKDDVIVSTVRPNLKNIAYFDYKNTYIPIASTGFAVLRANESIINPKYLFHIVLTDYFTNILMSVATGANYPAVKESDVRNIKVPIIDIEKQNQFAAFVEKIEKQKQILNDSLGNLTDLFDSLMQYAFDGSMTK